MTRVLVTGGAGFLGSHICEFYSYKGDKVIAFDNFTKHELERSGYSATLAREYMENFLKDLGVTIDRGDVRNFKDLDKYKDIDYIIHTAAQPAMTIAIERPRFDFDNNVLGTLNVLELARKLDIPVAVCSSIHVYGNNINCVLKETDTRFRKEIGSSEIDEHSRLLWGEITPLHASKRSAEIYTQSYIDTYGLEACVFRLTGMYGPRQFGSEDHGWVANFAIRLLTQRPITIFGTDKQVRDILYVKDAVNAFHQFYISRVPGVYNIGGGMRNSISLIECIRELEDITGLKADLRYEKARRGDLWYFVCDSGKAKRNLFWEPLTSNRDGLVRLVEWIKENKVIFV